MENNLKTHEIKIANISLRLKSPRNKEVVDSMVTLVNDKVAKALSNNKIKSVSNALVIVALNLADDLYELKTSTKEKVDDIEQLTLDLISELEPKTEVSA